MPTPLLILAQAVRVADVLLTLGVNTHLEYTDGAYADTARVIADLDYLGIHMLRDGTPNPRGGIPYQNYRAAIAAVTARGNRFDFFTGPGLPLAATLGEIDAVARARPGAVIAVEGPNEINNFPVSYDGLTGAAAAQAWQHALYAAVAADPMLHGSVVYDFTGGPRAGGLRGLADLANAHPYPYGGQQPARRIAAEFAADYSLATPYPKVITETGYHDAPHNPDGSGVDDLTQAKNTLNLLLDAYAAGVSRTYLYQLLSAYPDDGTNGDTEYGLFRLDNSPKPVATALHTLTALLADPGAAATRFAPASLPCTLSGLPPGGSALLMQASDGRFDLAVWAEPPDWDARAQRPIVVPATPVTVAFAIAVAQVAVFDPLRGSAVVRQTSNSRRVVIDLADHPVIVEIRPKPTASGP